MERFRSVFKAVTYKRGELLLEAGAKHERTLEAVACTSLFGLCLTAVALPVRIGILWAQRRLMFRGESSGNSLRVSLALAPTLIFTLVLAGILLARFGIPPALFGGLLLYAALTTLLPSLVFRTPFDVEPVDDQVLHGPAEAPADGNPAAGLETAPDAPRHPA